MLFIKVDSSYEWGGQTVVCGTEVMLKSHSLF